MKRSFLFQHYGVIVLSLHVTSTIIVSWNFPCFVLCLQQALDCCYILSIFAVSIFIFVISFSLTFSDGHGFDDFGWGSHRGQIL